MPHVFGIVGVPKRGFGPLTKPAPGSVIDWQHPLAQGLIGSYVFIDTPYATNDVTKSKLTSLTGTPTVNNVGFVGSNTRLRDLNEEPLRVGREITLLADVVRISSTPGYQGIVEKRTYGSSAAIEYSCYWYNSKMHGNFGGSDKTSTLDIPINVRQSVGVSFKEDADAISFIVGRATDSQALYGDQIMDAGSAEFCIGKVSNSSLYWSGYIASVFVWRRALQLGELQQASHSPYQFFYEPRKRVIFPPLAVTLSLAASRHPFGVVGMPKPW